MGFNLGGIVVIILLVIAFTTLLFMNVGGAKDKICANFGKYLPGFCGDVGAEIKGPSAEDSLKALTCAVNSVSKGEVWEGEYCDEYYSGQAAGFSSVDPENRELPEVDCDIKNVYTCGYIYGSRCFWDFTSEQVGENEQEALDKCQADFDDRDLGILASSLCIRKEEIKRSEYCNVTNFQLPQSFYGDSPSAWIGGWGDPRYVAVYQNLIPGEDSPWAGWSAWMKGSRTTVFLTSCLMSIGSGFLKVGKGAWSAVKHPKTALTNALTKSKNLLSKSFESQSKEVGLKIGEAAAEKTISLFPELVTRRSLIESMKQKFREKVKQIEISKAVEIAKSTAKEAGLKTTLTGVAAGAASEDDYFVDKRFDTEFGKFVPKGNKMVLYEPGETLMELNVLNLKEPKEEDKYRYGATKASSFDVGKPVLLEKENGELVQWHSESPCRADLTVREEKIRCGSYSHDAKTGVVVCEDPTREDKGLGECGAFQTIIPQEGDNDFAYREVEIVNDLGSYEIFRDSDGDGKWDIIYDPINRLTFHFNWTEAEGDRLGWHYTGGKIESVETEDGELVLKDDRFSKPYCVNFDEAGQDAFIQEHEDQFTCSVSQTVEKADIKLPETPWGSYKSASTVLLGTRETVCGVCGWEEGDEVVKEEDASPVSGIDEDAARENCEELLRETHGDEFIKTHTVAVDNCVKKDNFNAIMIKKGYAPVFGRHEFVRIILKDKDGDGNLDYLGHFKSPSVGDGDLFELFSLGRLGYIIFDDVDYDGRFDSLSSTPCNIEAVKVTYNQKPYEGEKYNFCYKKGKTWAKAASETALTFGMYAGVSLLGAVPYVGPVLATAGYCAAGIYDATRDDPYWPKQG